MIQFNVTFQSRDFHPIPPLPHSFQVEKLSWSAQGGPASAVISTQSAPETLFSLLPLLRAPVIVSDCFSNPAWWGFVSQIHITVQGTHYNLSIDDLFNKVKVVYSYISPNNINASPLVETPFSHHLASQSEYGVKEKFLYRTGIGDDFALALRDTFLEAAAKPRTFFGPLSGSNPAKVALVCQGWFQTLSWRFHQDLTGFYANHGPGPGTQIFATATSQRLAQHFTSLSDGSVKHAYFLIRKNNSPAANVYCQITTSDGTNPTATVLGTSANIAGSTIPQGFTWTKFTFDPPVSLSANTNYWAVIRASANHATDNFSARLDENRSFNQVGMVAKYYDGAWKSTTAVTTGFTPVAYFRIVTVQDTGQILHSISTSLGQFFTSIHTLSTGVNACPFSDDNRTALEEVQSLMNLGTVNLRPVLSQVDSNRRLTFFEAPGPTFPTVSMDTQGRFFSLSGQLIPAWTPPIGQYAILSGSDHFAPPFDNFRTPNYFVDNYTFFNS